MAKQRFDYRVQYTGTPKEVKKFEELLDSLRFTVEDMQEWDDVNNEGNHPSGIVVWMKFKYLKAAEMIVHRKVSKT